MEPIFKLLNDSEWSKQKDIQFMEFIKANTSTINSTTETSKQTPLIVAARNGLINVVNFILSQNVDVNQTDKQGMTALMLAAFEGHVNIVNILIEHGADVHIVNKDGNTALLLASWEIYTKNR